MNDSISASVDAYLRSIFELESNKKWVQPSPNMWMRPYFDKAIAEVWLVTVTIRDGRTTLGLFKQHSEYTLE